MLEQPQPLQPLQPRQYYLDELGSSDPLSPLYNFNPSRFYKGFQLRERFVKEYGFAILTRETLTALVALFGSRKVMEAGSGTGYMSKALRDAGVEVTAVDSNTGTYGFATPYARDIEADAVALLPGDFEAVLLVWPCYALPFGHQVISRMKPGQILVSQGEGHGGCTADDAFFEELESERWQYLDAQSDALNEGHVQFSGIHDRWDVYQRLEVA